MAVAQREPHNSNTKKCIDGIPAASVRGHLAGYISTLLTGLQTGHPDRNRCATRGFYSSSPTRRVRAWGVPRIGHRWELGMGSSTIKPSSFSQHFPGENNRSKIDQFLDHFYSFPSRPTRDKQTDGTGLGHVRVVVSTRGPWEMNRAAGNSVRREPRIPKSPKRTFLAGDMG